MHGVCTQLFGQHSGLLLDMAGTPTASQKSFQVTKRCQIKNQVQEVQVFFQN